MTAMSLASAPNPVELQEFQFKLFSRLRIFPEETPISLRDNLSLVCSASKYGLLFVGCPSGFQVLLTSSIIEVQDNLVKSRSELSEYPRRETSLPSQPTHLGVSCDGQFLAVIFSTDSCHIIRVYFVPSFFSQSIRVLHEIRATSDLNIQVSGVSWNPGVSNLLALCFSDGSICVYEFKEATFIVNSAPAEARANCLCWSPKGKQIVVGSSDGTLTQYKPELKAVKQLPAPTINQHPVSVVSVQWLSNYQFAVVYRDMVDTNERPALMLVNAPKSGPQTLINYEDICYSTGNLRPPQFYLEHVQQWKVLIVGASNSIEVGVLGCLNRASDEWQQWVQEDSSRADLPLTKSHQETFPVGLALDTSIQYCLPYGENQKYPPMPMLCLYSHDGLLCTFFIVNSLENTEQICAPPLLPPDQSGLSLFTIPVSMPKAVAAVPEPAPNENVPVPVSQVLPFQVTPQLAPSTPVSGGFQTPVTSAGGFQTSFHPEAVPGHTSWMTSATSISKVESKGKESTTGIENITPPHGGIQPPPVSGLGGMSLFGGTGSGLQFQKTMPQQQQLPLQSQPPVQSLQTPQKQPMPLNFAFNPVAPGGSPSLGFFAGNTGNASVSSTGFGRGMTTSAVTSGDGQTGIVPVAAPIIQPVQVSQPVASAALTPPASVSASVQPTSPTVSHAEEAVPTDNSQESIIIREEVVNAAIVDEVAHFDAELKEIFNSFRNMDIKIGDNAGKVEINTTMESLETFWTEVKETTAGLKTEVDTLKNSMLETFCYVEDAKARNYQCQNPGYKKLVYSQELDPMSKRRLDSINHYIFYIDSQIKEANRVIDDRWLSHQDKKKLSKGPLRIPPREELYQTLVIQNNIINKQKLIVEDIQHRIKQRNLKLESRTTPFISNLGMKKSTKYNKGDVELSKLAENLLQVKLNEREFLSLNTSVKGRLNRAEENVSKENYTVTEEKKNLLRQIHSEVISSIPKVRVPRPFTVSKPSGVSSYTPTPKASASSTYHMSPGDQLVQKYLKSGLSKSKSDTPETKSSSDLSAVKKPDLLLRAETASGCQNIEASTVLSTGRNQQKDIRKLVYNQITDLVKPVVIQHTPNILGPKKETVIVDNSNKENIPLSSTSLNINPEKTESGFGVREPVNPLVVLKTPDKQLLPTATPFVPRSDVAVSNEEMQKTPPPLVSMNKIVSSIGELSDAKVTSTPLQHSQSNLFGNLGSAQTGSSGLFSNFASIPEFHPKGSNQEQPKPQTIFGDAFNKSLAAAKQTTESSKVTEAVAFSPGTSFFKGTSLTPSSSSTPNTSFTSTFSFVTQDSSQNKSGSIFGGKPPSSSPLNIDFGKNLPVGSPSVPQDQPQKAKDVTKNDATSSAVKEMPDQSVQVSKVGSIFGGTVISTSTPAFTFGSGKNLFGGNVSATAGQTGFSFGSNLTGTAKTSDTLKTPESTFQLSFTNPNSNAPPSTTSFGTVFTSPGTTVGSENPGTTASSAAGAASTFSFTSAWATSTNKPVNFGSEVSSSNDDKVSETVTAAAVVPAGVTNSATSSITNAAFTVPVVTSAPASNTFTNPPAESAPASPTVSGATTTATTVPAMGAISDSNVVPDIATSDVPPSDTTSTIVSNGSPVISTTVSTPAVGSTSSVIATKSVSSSVETSSTSPTNMFSFGKLSVSSTDSSTPAVASAASEFSFAQILPTSTADSSAKMTLAFGQSSPSLGTSLFGGNSSSTGASPTTNLFGQSAQQTAVSTPSSTSFTFALPTDSTQQPSSTTTSFFGGKSLFGSTPAATTTTTTSFFGQPPSTPASTTASNIFGQGLPTSATSPFSQMSSAQQPSGFGTTAFGSKPAFGQSGGSLFGQASSGGFGATTSPVFGSTSVFGSTPSTPDNSAQTGGLFQSPGSVGGLFGARTNTSTSPGGSFSTGGQTISQTGFGTPAFQNKPAGGFGSSPTFGSAPSFGGAPTFGGSPTFGNPGKVFGSTSPTSGFGSGTQQSTTFENLANQNTMSFGNLAQNQQQPSFGSGAPLFGAATQGTPAPAPAFPPTTFGGNSFSSWR